MSKSSEPLYGQIKLKCLRGHELGAILVQPRRRIAGQIQTLRRLDAVMKAPPKVAPPEAPEPETVQGVPIPPGLPFRATCRACRQQNSPKYCYEECWELVEPEIRKLAERRYSRSRSDKDRCAIVLANSPVEGRYSVLGVDHGFLIYPALNRNPCGTTPFISNPCPAQAAR